MGDPNYWKSERSIVLLKLVKASSGKGPHFWVLLKRLKVRRLTSQGLKTPEKIRKFQRKLYRKAKREPGFRFYSLYDKVYREDVLAHAYRLIKGKRGGPGIDGQTFNDIEKEGLSNWLKDLREDLKEGTYKPMSLKRVEIEKESGGLRPLSIPTIRDRVVQMAAKLVLEPIFEADFKDQAYGYRPNRDCLDAVDKVRTDLRNGYTQIVDADISGYFDNIPHHQLLKSVANRVSDGSILALIKSWLKVAIVEEDDGGDETITGGKESTRGVPQGGVISPLLANIYMNRFLKAWNNYDKQREFRARLINYADDFVILSRTKKGAHQALEWTRYVMKVMGLTLNGEKTRLCDLDKESFNFLGYTFGMECYHKTGSWYKAAKPSPSSVKGLKERVKLLLSPGNKKPWDEIVEKLNYLLTGWANYYSYGTVGFAYRAIDHYVYDRLLHFRKRRHKLSSRGTNTLPQDQIYSQLGVYRLCGKGK